MDGEARNAADTDDPLETYMRWLTTLRVDHRVTDTVTLIQRKERARDRVSCDAQRPRIGDHRNGTAWSKIGRRALVAVTVALSVVWLSYYALLATFMVQKLHMNDFGKFYYSTRLFLDGQNMYGPTAATNIPVSTTESVQFLNMNPPHFHLLMLPLAVLPQQNALELWFIANLAALIVSVNLISSELGIRWTPVRLFCAVSASIICSATGTIVVTGQLTFLLLLPVTLAWVAARHGDWNRSALFLGIAASVKPFLGIFLVYLFLARRFKPAAVMVSWVLLCGLLGLSVFGWQAYANWLASLSSVDWTWAPMNGSIAGLIARALNDSPYYTPIFHAPSLAGILTGVLTAGLAAFSISVFLRDTSETVVDRTFAGLLLTALLVSPLGWVYYLWLLIGPMVALWQASRSRPSRLRDALAILAMPGLVTPFALTAMWGTSKFSGVTLGSLYGWTTLFLWGWVVADWASTRPVRATQVASPFDRASSSPSAGWVRSSPSSNSRLA